MTRILITILLGLLVGVVTHVTYFHFRQPKYSNSLDGQLAWMKMELKISDTQLKNIRALHQASAPRLHELAAQVARLESELEVFESIRRSSGKVDFIEFAQLIEARRELNRQCMDSTRQLVLASADLMSKSQRQQYLGLVSTSIPLSDLMN